MALIKTNARQLVGLSRAGSNPAVNQQCLSSLLSRLGWTGVCDHPWGWLTMLRAQISGIAKTSGGLTRSVSVGGVDDLAVVPLGF